MENVRKHRDIELATTERRRSYLISEPNYHVRNYHFHRKFISNRNEKNSYLLDNRSEDKNGKGTKKCVIK